MRHKVPISLWFSGNALQDSRVPNGSQRLIHSISWSTRMASLVKTEISLIANARRTPPFFPVPGSPVPNFQPCSSASLEPARPGYPFSHLPVNYLPNGIQYRRRIYLILSAHGVPEALALRAPPCPFPFLCIL